MNRIVIIGNGFDLAHGLETRYEDFIVDLIKKAISNKIDGLRDVDLFTVELPKIRDLRGTTQKEFLKIKRLEDIFSSNLINLKIGSGVHSNLISGERRKEYSTKIRVSCSDFIKGLFKNKNWTDIEKYYFNCLLDLLDKYNSGKGTKEHFQKVLEDLNTEFSSLRNYLCDYILHINDGITSSSIPFFNKLLSLLSQEIDDTYYNDFFNTNNPRYITRKTNNRTILINFNYTSILNEYQKPKNMMVFNIHGSASSKDIIFGYGDLTHEKYSELENADNFELLRNMKSFYYPSSKNYIDIMNVLNLDQYDVCVVGHSLGLSDRVMLKSIFEHENCKAIKLFHKGDEESHFRKRVALSRHFSDKERMNKMIVPFNPKDVIDC